jgi:hypothetical protein
MQARWLARMAYSHNKASAARQNIRLRYILLTAKRNAKLTPLALLLQENSGSGFFLRDDERC